MGFFKNKIDWKIIIWKNYNHKNMLNNDPFVIYYALLFQLFVIYFDISISIIKILFLNFNQGLNSGGFLKNLKFLDFAVWHKKNIPSSILPLTIFGH